VVAFFRFEAANDRELIGVLGQLRQMLAKPHAGHVRGNFLELAAILVTRFHVPRISLAWAAGHPQQDAVTPAARVFSKLRGERREPAADTHAASTARHRVKQTAPID